MLLALLQGYRSGVKGSIPNRPGVPGVKTRQEGPFRAPFRSRHGDLVEPMGFVTFQESNGDPQIECDRIDELGDFLHNKITKIPVLAISEVFRWLKFAKKRSTMLNKKNLLFVSIHVNQGGFARGLTQEFYEMCKTKLNPGGILVTQAKGVFRPRMMIG